MRSSWVSESWVCFTRYDALDEKCVAPILTEMKHTPESLHGEHRGIPNLFGTFAFRPQQVGDSDIPALRNPKVSEKLVPLALCPRTPPTRLRRELSRAGYATFIPRLLPPSPRPELGAKARGRLV